MPKLHAIRVSYGYELNRIIKPYDATFRPSYRLPESYRSFMVDEG